ncbi:MAG TPA: glycosyltransferase family 39 protein [Vicinamibacteria bacterium]|nr:glycosyltransferase family 39 protein [Vicinamibacteria bacterium]
MSALEKAWRPSRTVAPLLLAACAVLALDAARGDSITTDEPVHLVAGESVWRTADFRLSPDHPPLGRLWAALPLRFLSHQWPPPEAPAWQRGDFWEMGWLWLSELNDGDRLILPARTMIVALLLILCLLVQSTAKSLFGGRAALLALAMAALDPTLLAHGHYVTTDLAMALLALTSLVTWARMLDRPTPGRIMAAASSLAGAALIKFSWIALIPALGAMVALAILRSDPGTRRRQALRLSAILLGLATWLVLGIWAGYGFRYSAFCERDRTTALMTAAPDFGAALPTSMAEAWETVLHDPSTAKPRGDAVSAGLGWAREHRLLPEAYLFGMAAARKQSLYRSAYLMGRHSVTGWPWYFPVAFLIKTPLVTILLFLAGLLAIAQRRVPLGEPLLAAGLLVFGLTYGAAALVSHLNIGQRHLLPLYPIVFLVASAAASWWPTRLGKILLGAAACWLTGTAAWTHPHQLAYFNELVGGARNGHLYLTDSNLDWGQDLKRLAEYGRRHPEKTLFLARSGEAPMPRALRVKIALAESERQPLDDLTAGTYAVSATRLSGVYQPLVRDDAWRDEALQRRYRALHAVANGSASMGELAGSDRLWALREYHILRRFRLVNRLRTRPPDERVGASLLLYHLTDEDLATLTSP